MSFEQRLRLLQRFEEENGEFGRLLLLLQSLNEVALSLDTLGALDEAPSVYSEMRSAFAHPRLFNGVK